MAEAPLEFFLKARVNSFSVIRKQDKKEKNNKAVSFQCLLSPFIPASYLYRLDVGLMLAYAYISVNG